MSTVYRAFDSVLERRVAVKLMHREIAADTDQLERFRREARAVAQLSHPHIVGVIDAGEEDGRPYIVFEYVEGETLKDRIRRMGRLPVDEAIAYAIEIARALERRARPPHRPPRRQAPERPDRRGGLGQGHRLRHRPLARRGGPDRRRPRARHHRLRLPRAGARPRRQRPVRHLLARRRAVRDAHRRRPLPRREPGRGGDEARPRGPPRRADAPPRRLRGPRGDPRPHDGQAPRAPLPRRAHARDRPRGRARRRGRPLRPRDRRGDRGDRDAPRARAPPRSRCACAGGSRSSPSSACCCWPAPSSPCSSLQGLERTQRGTGEGKVKPPPGTKVVSVKRTSRPGLRPARRRRRARRPGVPRRRQGPRPPRGPPRATAAARSPARTASASTSTPPRASPRPGSRSTRRSPAGRSRSTSPPTAPRPTARPAKAGDWQKVGGGKVKRKRQRFKLRTDGKRTATTSCGSRSCPSRRRSASRSPTSRCSARRDLERVARALGAVALEPEAQQPVADLGERAARWPPTSSGSRSSPSCPGAC